MLLIVVSLLIVVALAGLVAVAAAPERGRPIPQPVRLSDRMTKLRNRIQP